MKTQPFSLARQTRQTLGNLLPQPLLGFVAGIGALCLLLWAWIPTMFDSVRWLSLDTLLVVGLLLTAVILAERYPIHLRHNMKLFITTAPLYLMAVMLPPPLAALAAGLSILIAEWQMHAVRGLSWSDLALAAGRWTIIAFAGSLVAHWTEDDAMIQAFELVGSAAIMFALDMLTTSLEVAAMSGEAPHQVLQVLLRESSLVESVQYLLGMLGALAAMHDTWALVLLSLPTAIVYLAFKNAKQMHESTRQLLESMADAVDLRDPYTGGHSRRVADYCAGILRELATIGEEAELVFAAARVHDIGKIGMPDDILKKAGALTPAEHKTIEGHSAAGANLLKRHPEFARGREIVLHHHERWDGRGYPARLKGMKIPLGARVIAVADAYDAMTTDRPYRRALLPQQAVATLKQESGRQWDPRIVDAFLRSIGITADEPAAVSEPAARQAGAVPTIAAS